MEHEKDNDNLVNFDTDSDFDRMLEEKTKGWQKPQSEQELIDSLKQVNQYTDERIQRKVSSLPVESVNAAVEKSEPTTESQTVDGEPAPSVESASGAVNSTPEDSSNTDTVVASPEPSIEDAKNLPSNPAFTASLLTAHPAKTSVRGIKTGPWARQYTVTETVSESEMFDNIGQQNLEAVWKQIIEKGQRVRESKGIEGVIELMGLWHKAAFFSQYTLHALQTILEKAIESGNEEERKRAEAAYTKMMGAKKQLSSGDGSGKTVKARSRSSEPKLPKIKKTIKDSIDQIVATMGLDGEQILAMYKVKRPLDLTPEVVAYLKSIKKAS